MTRLQYCRLKLTASAIRIMTRLAMGVPSVSPDEVLQIPSRDEGRFIKVNVYRPPEVSYPSPILVNFHGSGFMIPMHGSDEPFCRKISNMTGHIVFDTQYRLSPENPFPAPLDDAEDVVKWILRHPSDFDSNRVAMSGFSAGGNIALATAAATFPPGVIRSVIALYPVTDVSIAPEAKTPPDSSGRPIPNFVAHTSDECYLPAHTNKADPRVSPSYADASRFPANVLVITASGDNLALEAENLVKRIQEQTDKHAICRRMEHCNHAWDKEVQKEGSSGAKATEEAYGLAIEMLKTQ